MNKLKTLFFTAFCLGVFQVAQAGWTQAQKDLAANIAKYQYPIAETHHGFIRNSESKGPGFEASDVLSMFDDKRLNKLGQTEAADLIRWMRDNPRQADNAMEEKIGGRQNYDISELKAGLVHRFFWQVKQGFTSDNPNGSGFLRYGAAALAAKIKDQPGFEDFNKFHAQQEVKRALAPRLTNSGRAQALAQSLGFELTNRKDFQNDFWKKFFEHQEKIGMDLDYLKNVAKATPDNALKAFDLQSRRHKNPQLVEMAENLATKARNPADPLDFLKALDEPNIDSLKKKGASDDALALLRWMHNNPEAAMAAADSGGKGFETPYGKFIKSQPLNGLMHSILWKAHKGFALDGGPGQSGLNSLVQDFKDNANDDVNKQLAREKEKRRIIDNYFDGKEPQGLDLRSVLGGPYLGVRPQKYDLTTEAGKEKYRLDNSRVLWNRFFDNQKNFGPSSEQIDFDKHLEGQLKQLSGPELDRLKNNFSGVKKFRDKLPADNRLSPDFSQELEGAFSARMAYPPQTPPAAFLGLQGRAHGLLSPMEAGAGAFRLPTPNAARPGPEARPAFTPGAFRLPTPTAAGQVRHGRAHGHLPPLGAPNHAYGLPRPRPGSARGSRPGSSKVSRQR